MDKTFAAIEKLKEVELELHRLKNYVEMMNRSVEAQREWQGLTDEEIGTVIGNCNITLVNYCSEEKQTAFARAIEDKLKAKNSA